jgi:hypothetical protein
MVPRGWLKSHPFHHCETAKEITLSVKNCEGASILESMSPVPCAHSSKRQPNVGQDRVVVPHGFFWREPRQQLTIIEISQDFNSHRQTDNGIIIPSL